MARLEVYGEKVRQSTWTFSSYTSFFSLVGFLTTEIAPVALFISNEPSLPVKNRDMQG